MSSEKKTILIFGAGINQLELIRAAKELGVVSVVIDPMLDPPGKNEADYFYQVDGNDYEGTKQIAIKHKVDGIVTAQMENPLRLMAKLSEEMCYNFPSPDIIEQCRNKFMMKKAFLKHSVPCAKGIVLSNKVTISLELLQKHNLSFPLIIKPLDAHSSRGVYKAENIEELLSHTNESADFSSTGEFLVEEFLEGKEYSVESITFNRKTQIIQITEKIITPYPRTVEIGHLQPATLNSDERKTIETVTREAIGALRIDNSASHTELKLTVNGVKIIEIGARLGGDFISSYLTKASTGISMDKAAIQVSIGIKPDLTPTKNICSFIKYIQLPVGKIVQEVIQVQEIIKIPSVVFTHIFVKPGDVIHAIEHSAQRPACVIVTANSIAEVNSIALKVENLIKEKSIKLL